MEHSQTEGNLSMFEDLLSDEGAIGMHDPLSQSEPYSPEDDVDNFQKSSNATTTKEQESGYRELGNSLMNDDDENTDEQPEDDNDLIRSVLRQKGFNPNSIKFENEDGEIEEHRFEDLSLEDQKAILDTDPYEFEDHELNAIAYLRENNMTLEELAQVIRQQTIDQMQNQEAEQKSYTVDDFSNDELFIVDFRNKYGEDFTDDELLIELDKAKENPEIYEKRINKLREDYKKYEEETARQEMEAQQKYIQEQKDQYTSTMINTAKSISDLHDTAEIDDNDRNEILNFILTEDQSGVTDFQRSLQDPRNVFKAAWYLQHGDEVFNEIHRYYQAEITKLTKANKSNKVESVVKTNKNQNKTQHTTQRHTKIEDLFY